MSLYNWSNLPLKPIPIWPLKNPPIPPIVLPIKSEVPSALFTFWIAANNGGMSVAIWVTAATFDWSTGSPISSSLNFCTKSVRSGIISSTNDCKPVFPVSNWEAKSVSIMPNAAMSTTNKSTIASDKTFKTLPINLIVSAPLLMFSSPSILAVPPSSAIAPSGNTNKPIASVTSNNELAIPIPNANVKGSTNPNSKLIAKKPPMNIAIGASIWCNALPIQDITSSPLSRLVPKNEAVPPSNAIAVIGAISKAMASATNPTAIAIP